MANLLTLTPPVLFNVVKATVLYIGLVMCGKSPFIWFIVTISLLTIRIIHKTLCTVMATRFSGKTSILVLLQPAVYHMNIISQSFTRLKTELIRI